MIIGVEEIDREKGDKDIKSDREGSVSSESSLELAQAKVIPKPSKWKAEGCQTLQENSSCSDIGAHLQSKRQRNTTRHLQATLDTTTKAKRGNSARNLGDLVPNAQLLAKRLEYLENDNRSGYNSSAKGSHDSSRSKAHGASQASDKRKKPKSEYVRENNSIVVVQDAVTHE